MSSEERFRTAPIVMRCEGSGAESDYCQMCARTDVIADGRVLDHDRLDILAMLDRGDFEVTEERFRTVADQLVAAIIEFEGPESQWPEAAAPSLRAALAAYDAACREAAE